MICETKANSFRDTIKKKSNNIFWLYNKNKVKKS